MVGWRTLTTHGCNTELVYYMTGKNNTNLYLPSDNHSGLQSATHQSAYPESCRAHQDWEHHPLGSVYVMETDLPQQTVVANW